MNAGLVVKGMFTNTIITRTIIVSVGFVWSTRGKRLVVVVHSQIHPLCTLPPSFPRRHLHHRHHRRHHQQHHCQPSECRVHVADHLTGEEGAGRIPRLPVLHLHFVDGAHPITAAGARTETPGTLFLWVRLPYVELRAPPARNNASPLLRCSYNARPRATPRTAPAPLAPGTEGGVVQPHSPEQLVPRQGLSGVSSAPR